MLLQLLLSLHVLSGTLGDNKPTIWNPVDQISVDAHPNQQHVPENFPHLLAKRPPRPLMPQHRSPSIFIGIAAFRDGKRCGNTLYTAFLNAEDASRVFIGVVDQVTATDAACLASYCALAKEKGYVDQLDSTHPLYPDCPHINQIRILAKSAAESKGPAVARAWQQQLLRNEDFCLQIDAHSIFTESWDSVLIQDWLRAGNEMAVLSTYITDYASRKTWPKNQHPHLCRAIVGGNGLVRNDGASIAGNIRKPQLTCFWGAGLSFSKCHSERRVPLDPFSFWVFDGEEFVKAARLWTHGYDLYTPTSFAIYHDYTPVPHRFEQVALDPILKDKEVVMGINRVKLVLELAFEGPVKSDDIEQYKMGSVRSLAAYLNFSGIVLQDRAKDQNRCKQLHWMPYAPNNVDIKQLVESQLQEDWMFYPPYDTTLPPDYTSAVFQVKADKSQRQFGAANTIVTGNSGTGLSGLFLLTLVVALVLFVRKYLLDGTQEWKDPTHKI